MKKKKGNIASKEYYETLIAKKQYEQIIKPWYLKLDYWKVVIGGVIMIFSATVGYKNGLFDFRQKQLDIEVKAMELKKENLDFDIKKNASFQETLIATRDRLFAENAELESKKAQLMLANKKAYANLDERGKQMFAINQELNDLKKKNHDLEYERNFGRSSVFNNQTLSSINASSLSEISKYFSDNSKPYSSIKGLDVSQASLGNTVTTNNGLSDALYRQQSGLLGNTDWRGIEYFKNKGVDLSEYIKVNSDGSIQNYLPSLNSKVIDYRTLALEKPKN